MQLIPAAAVEKHGTVLLGVPGGGRESYLSLVCHFGHRIVTLVSRCQIPQNVPSMGVPSRVRGHPSYVHGLTGAIRNGKRVEGPITHGRPQAHAQLSTAHVADVQ